MRVVIEHLRSIEDDDIQSHLGIILGDDVALHVLSAGESDAAGLDIGLNVGSRCRRSGHTGWSC